MSDYSSSHVAANIRWNVAGTVIGRSAGPLLQVLIARVLDPTDYGVFAIAFAVVALLEVVRDVGLTQAIIVERSNFDYVALQFWTQMALAVILYALVIVAGPLAAELFSEPELTSVFSLVGLTLFLAALSDPITTHLLKTQNYRVLSLRHIVMPVVAGITGLVLAHAGYGVYALVIGLLAGYLANTVMLAGLYKGRFGLYWSASIFSRLYRFGRHIVAQRFSGFLVNQADSFFVLLGLGAGSLGVYRLGNQLSLLLPSLVLPQAQQVLFTEFSANRERTNVSQLYYKYVAWAGGALILYSVCAYYSAPWLTRIVLGDQWLGMVPVIQIISASAVTGYLASLNLEAARALGIVRPYTLFTVVRSLVTIVTVAYAATHSLYAVVIAWAGVAMIANVVNEIVFYTSQHVVPLRRGKIGIYVVAWVWAAYVVTNTRF